MATINSMPYFRAYSHLVSGSVSATVGGNPLATDQPCDNVIIFGASNLLVGGSNSQLCALTADMQMSVDIDNLNKVYVKNGSGSGSFTVNFMYQY